MSESHSEISQVSNILTKSLAALNAAVNETDRAKAFATVQAAYGKLETLALPPGLLLQQISMSYQLPMVLGTVNDLGIAEVLSESNGSGGRMSSKEIEEFAKGAPVPTWISLTVKQGGMAAVSMVTAFREDKYKKSHEISETPFSKIYNTDVPFWKWLEQEGRELNVAKAFEVNNARNFDFSYYPWKDLPEDPIVVDVGGGEGSAMAVVLPLAHEGTKAIIQDLSLPVLEHAKTFWAERDSTAVLEGRVVLQQQDFFQPQPVKGAAVYFLRFVLHDWKDEKCIEILKHLHDATNEESRLLIVEAVVSHACRDIGSLKDDGVEGAYPAPMPKPLPANGGRATEFEAGFDMHMMNILNGGERTYEQFRQLAAKAGWKPKKVYQTDEISSLKILEFVSEYGLDAASYAKVFKFALAVVHLPA
ncbi:hypothetical protein FRC01_005995 [Tulasnella sp. 417]|nr:hypothetical protein FRC01_005995 [Tulasnella sp. 417]